MKVRLLDLVMVFWIGALFKILGTGDWGLTLSEYSQLGLLLMKIVKPFSSSPMTEKIQHWMREMEILNETTSRLWN